MKINFSAMEEAALLERNITMVSVWPFYNIRIS